MNCKALQVAFKAKEQPDANPETIADAIYQHAMNRRSKDDVSIIVLSLAAQGFAQGQ